MNQLHFAENLVRLRKERKITQEELADFLCITKASISKWENHQSMPDILLLPQLAAFFGVTVDALLGYEPQMSKEQIRACYQRLAHDFANRPFEEVMEESEKLVKKYYSCYPFLMQIGVLWTNHFMMAESKERQNEILEQMEKLCQHILDHCNDLITANQAMEMKAIADLQRGKAQNVIDSLEEICQADCMEQKAGLLIQAYLMQGYKEQAEKTLQAGLYRNVIQTVSYQIILLVVHVQEMERCEEIIKRTDALIEIFQMQHLNPNLTANYQYQAALVYLGFGREEEAVYRLEEYAKSIEELFRSGITLKGDAYFDRMDEWFADLQLGGERVRDPKLVAESSRSVFSHPLLQAVKNKEKVAEIEKKVAAACQIKQGE